jgi:cytochrome c-type biogenesis protein CcmH/NrfG
VSKWLKQVALAAVLATGMAADAHADSYGHVQGALTKSENQLEAEKHMAAGEWKEAVPLLEARIAGHPSDVEALADLGHSYAESGDLDQAIEKLKVAVDLEPRHLEANLYLGEAYLKLRDLPHALERLSALDTICFFGCGAYRTLKNDVEAYRAANGS